MPSYNLKSTFSIRLYMFLVVNMRYFSNNGRSNFAFILRIVLLLAIIIIISLQLTACAPKMTNPISKDDDMTVQSEQSHDEQTELKHHKIIL